MFYRFVELDCDPGRERASALGQCPHGEEHPAHVGMHDDGIGGLLRKFHAGDRAALEPLGGVGAGGLIRGLAEAQALDADAEPRAIHHGEHGAHALVRLAHEITLGGVEIHHAR